MNKPLPSHSQARCPRLVGPSRTVFALALAGCAAFTVCALALLAWIPPSSDPSALALEDTDVESLMAAGICAWVGLLALGACLRDRSTSTFRIWPQAALGLVAVSLVGILIVSSL